MKLFSTESSSEIHVTTRVTSMVAPCFHPCSDPSGVSSFSVGKFSDLPGLFSTPSDLILRTSTHAQIPELLLNSVLLRTKLCLV